MIDKLFPKDVVTVAASPTMPIERLHPEEAALVRHAVAKRRHEFALGRTCAHRALRTLGIEDYPVLSGQHREPLWPRGVVGSLTHCEGYCAAAVARADRVAGLGVDAEASEALDGDLIARVCTPNEITWVQSNPPPRHSDWHKIIFSAKESVYKCIFPFVRRVLDFRDVEICLQPPNRFSTRLLFDPPEALAGLAGLQGRFATDVEHVLTGVTIHSCMDAR